MTTRSALALPYVCLLAAACNENGLRGKEEVPLGPKPDILVEPPALSFGSIPVGDESALPFTVTNVGDGALEVSGMAVVSGAEAFRLAPGTFDYTLAPGETRDFEAIYAPTEAEVFYGAIQVDSNDPDGDDSSVDLLGEGLVPDIRVEPSLLEWTNIARGDVSTQSFTVTNVGNATLSVTDVVLVQGATFTVDGPLTAFELAPGASTDVEVSFSPVSGALETGLVQVLSNDPDGDFSSVDLRGSGLQPDLEITPATFAFSDTFVPCGDTLTLTLENVGGEDLVIDDLSYASTTGELVLDSALALPVTLAPGETRTVDVHWVPTTAGAEAGELIVTSNDPDGDETATQTANAVWVASTSETFTAPAPPPVDVLITIDQSGSMETDNQDDVEQGFPLFLDELQQIADWRLLLVTRTDGCTTTGVMDSNNVNEQALVDGAFVAAHNDNGGANVTEQLLKLTDLALGQTGPGQCNANFLRPGALLHVITLSDEPEQSGQSAAYWVNRFYSYVTDPSLLKVSGVLDVSNACGLGAAGYTDAVALTGGASLDICDASWGSDFTDIAAEGLPVDPVYPLASPADPSTVVVTVNGVPTTSFSYDAGAQQVVVTSPPIAELDVVEIAYSIPGTCN